MTNKVVAAGLTSEEMILQAPIGHELVHKQELPLLQAVPQQPHQVRVRYPPQKVHFTLQKEIPSHGLDHSFK